MSEGGRRLVTSHDVAHAAGVSQSTVSRALRGEPGMSAVTRQRVAAAAGRLGYVPSERGRSLSTRVTRRIGVICPELTNQFYPELIEPLRVALEAVGYRPILIADRNESDDSVAWLTDGSVDGVVMTAAAWDSRLPYRLRERGLPVVLANRDIRGGDIDACVFDNAAGARQVAELLVGLGHRVIGMLCGPEEASTARERESGFRDSLAAHGLEVGEPLVRRGAYSYHSGHVGADGLLDVGEPPTAIFCMNDVIALGAANALVARGLRLGRDMTVVGFDDISTSSWDVVSLTTVRCDLPGLADGAVRMLMRRLQDGSTPVQRHVIEPGLVLRTSHGPPPDPDRLRRLLRRG